MPRCSAGFRLATVSGSSETRTAEVVAVGSGCGKSTEWIWRANIVDCRKIRSFGFYCAGYNKYTIEY